MSLPKVVFLDRATIPSYINLPEVKHPHHWLSMNILSQRK